MTDAVAKLRWDLLADVAGFTGPLDQGAAAAEKMAARFNRAFDSIKQSAARAQHEQEAWSKSMQGDGSFLASSQTLGQGETSATRHRVRLADQLGLGQSARVELTREAAATAAAIGDVKKKIGGEMEKALSELGEKAGLGGVFGGAAKLVNGNPLLALGTLAGGAYIEHERERRNLVREVGHGAEAWGESTLGTSQLMGAGVSEEMGSHFQRAIAEPNAVFGQLGLDTDKLRAAPLKDAMLQVADAFQKVANPTDRAKMAVDMFGRAGDEMIPILGHLREKMDGLAESKLVTATERAEIKANDQAWNQMMKGAGDALSNALGLGPSSARTTHTLYRGWGMATDLLRGENPFSAEKAGKLDQEDWAVEHAEELERGRLAQEKLDAAARRDAQALIKQAEAVEKATAASEAIVGRARDSYRNWLEADDRGRPVNAAEEDEYRKQARASGKGDRDINRDIALIRQYGRKATELQGAWSLFGQSQTSREKLNDDLGNAETFRSTHTGPAAEATYGRMVSQARKNYLGREGFGTPVESEAARHAAALARIDEAQPADAAARIDAENLAHRQNLGIKDWQADFKKSLSDLEANRGDFTPEQFAKREQELRRRATQEAGEDIRTLSPMAALAAGSREAYSMMVQSQLNDPKLAAAREANGKLDLIKQAIEDAAAKEAAARVVAVPAAQLGILT